MRLEELISEFVARLAPCPPEQIDDEIEHGLGAILTLLGASRICWYRLAKVRQIWFACTR